MKPFIVPNGRRSFGVIGADQVMEWLRENDIKHEANRAVMTGTALPRPRKPPFDCHVGKRITFFNDADATLFKLRWM
jgi:hypothetical protein